MIPTLRTLRFAAAIGMLCVVSAAAQSPSRREQMLAAEDSRTTAPDGLRLLQDALTDSDPLIRRQAVRALGRFERPALMISVADALADGDPNVRMEAANAVGQLARTNDAVIDAKRRLIARSLIEPDRRVWGVVAATLGRLAYTTAADIDDAETVLATVLPPATGPFSDVDALVGAVEGFEALSRQTAKIARPKPSTVDGLRRASRLTAPAARADALVRVRRLALLALVSANAVDAATLESGAADADAEVRRLAMIAARADLAGRDKALKRGLADSNSQVRYDALQTWGRTLQKTSCEPVVAAVRDASPHVSLLAIDLLGAGCPSAQSPVAPLQALAEAITTTPRAWHAPAHALVALARTSPDAARTVLPRYTQHPTWQVRMYAARAAGVLGAVDQLTRLGADAHDNVREAALGELGSGKRPEAMAVALAALARDDYQLLQTAARTLAAAPDKAAAATALTRTLARITTARRDTSRDPRMAMLDALRQLGAPDGAVLGDPVAALGPYLNDFDPAVARRAGEILQGWQKPGAVAPPASLPTRRFAFDAIDALAAARVVVTMAGRGRFELRLFPDEAPVTAQTFATLAAQGYYNGLTFHRVAANFVLQGGSPGANEYMGAADYMRDEVGLRSHRRGTLGISTRGRDTGDAQIFINLVDSPRLDHQYTVFAEVVSGLDVVDAVIEGDVIEHVEIVPAPKR